MVSILTFCIAVVFGFILPGYFVSLRLGSPSKCVSSFLISILILFHATFWLGLFHVSLTFPVVLLVLVGFSAMAFVMVRKNKPQAQPKAEQSPINRMFVILLGIACLLMLARSIRSPLPGYDTFFRWNFLAEQMLRYRTFGFYPPLTPADFKIYFYVDGIAPLVSFCYWWLYAAAGSTIKALTAVFVVPQYVLLLMITYQVGRTLRKGNVGALAAVCLAASPLFFWSVYLGQETGLTALSLAATLFFLLKTDPENPTGGMLLAACAAAVGALAREYGGAILLCGLIVAIQRKMPVRSVLLFIAATLLLCAPWYIRNWFVAGNPFYSNPVGTFFAVNEVHVGVLRTFETLQGFGTDPLEKAMDVAKLLLRYAPLQFTVGILAVILLFSKFRALVICTLLLCLVWLYSTGIAAGGYFWSLRVLSPALVILSLLTGLLLDGLSQNENLRKLFSLLLVVACCQSLFFSALIPGSPGLLPWKTLFSAAFNPDKRHERWAQNMAPRLASLKCRILGDDAYAHAGLFRYGIEVVPVWSPEVRFVFDQTTPPEVIRERLKSLGIKAVLYNPHGATSLYLSKFPFFGEDIQRWVPYVTDGTFVVYRLP